MFFMADEVAYKAIDFNLFSKTKESLISEKKSFIEIDLSGKILRYYESGAIRKEYPVLAIGREGTWGETPAGIYKIGVKFENKLSGISKAYMPWGMQFQGNFLIHGWPYYPGGRLVDSKFSGGCIRISTNNARELFSMVKTGTPVLVFSDKILTDAFKYKTPLPEISAESFLAMDLKNGFVFSSNDSEKILPIYSINNLMLGLVAIEQIGSENSLLIDKSMLAATSRPRLLPGLRVKIYDLLLTLILESSDEAAMAISHYLGGLQRTSELMNRKAETIGMKNSVFADPRGLSKENKSSAEDLLILAKYIYGNRSFLFDISNGRLRYTANDRKTFQNLANVNALSYPEKYYGGKFSEGEGGFQNMIVVFEFEKGDSVRPVGIAVLKSQKAKEDVENIFAWIKTNY